MSPNDSNNSSNSGGGGEDFSFSNSFVQGMQRAQQWGQIWKLITQLVKFAFSLLALPWMPIVRTKLGERRFGMTQRLMGLFALILMVELAASYLGLLLIPLYLAACVEHTLAVHRRRKRGERWHSYCQGESRLAPIAQHISNLPGFNKVVITTKDLDLYLDPFILFAPGLLLATSMGNPFGWVMVLGGIGLAIEQRIVYSRIHNLVLDQIDQMIVSEQLSSTLSGEQDIEQTEGFIVPGAATWSDQERHMVADNLVDLDPAIKAILDPIPESDTLQSNGESKTSSENNKDSATASLLPTPSQ